MTAVATRATNVMTAVVTKGSHRATANAAPAAAADSAVHAVWVVPNIPWTRPTSDESDPWVRRDWSAGRAAAKPSASVAPRTIRIGTALTNG